MTPQEFIRKWKPVALNERQTAQEHFLDLCRLVEHPTPAEIDPSGESFSFEKGVAKSGGGDGYADVWKKGHFAWEYKKRKRDLDVALGQLVKYAAALENPPLHVVCDTLKIKIVTAWTNTVPKVYQFDLEHLDDPENLKVLRAVFHSPDDLRPKQTRAGLTKEAADKFQTISDRLQHRNPDREAVAHFVNQLVFCFFADSVKLLPEGLLRKLLRTAEKRPLRSKQYFDKLFTEMENGGELDLTDIAHFNGGLFDGRRALVLEEGEIGLLIAATSLSWSLIDPTIFGTLFERFLDPDKRSQIGAHYTDSDKIMLIVEPVIARPLRKEAADVLAQIEAIMKPAVAAADTRTGLRRGKTKTEFERAREKAEMIRDAFIDRLTRLKILDPACGSGNFLYLALQVVKDIEYRLILDCETLGLGMVTSRVGPEILYGIEINPFAAELARMTIWIGDIQWGIKNGAFHRPEPILRKLDSIECRDALLSKNDKGEWVEAPWPEVDFIVGNPPFLGGNKFKRKLTEAVTSNLRSVYSADVPSTVDLVCYWFYKATKLVCDKKINAFGLIATSAIRAGNNLAFFHRITDTQSLFEVWDDEPWVLDGANVRVSIICASSDPQDSLRLNGEVVSQINSDLTSFSFGGFARARRLSENLQIAFQGSKKVGDFEVDRKVAEDFLREPSNVNRRHNSDVLKRSWLSTDFMSRDRDAWIVDFGTSMIERDAQYYEKPFAHIVAGVKTKRAKNARAARSTTWWRHGDPQPAMRTAIVQLSRYIVTPEVHTLRSFRWADGRILPDCKIIVIAKDDLCTFGILSSRFHESWSKFNGGVRGAGRTYTPTTTFETFPFPEGLTPNIPAADYANDPRAQRIAAAAKKLDELRNNWLNPPDLVDIVPEVYPTPDMLAAGAKKIYPDRIVPKNADAAAKLRERTLTNLYNARPQWLVNAHDDLDRAVAAAYGWPEEIHIDEALGKLLELNLVRAATQLAPAPITASEDDEAD